MNKSNDQVTNSISQSPKMKSLTKSIKKESIRNEGQRNSSLIMGLKKSIAINDNDSIEMRIIEQMVIEEPLVIYAKS